MAEEKNIELIAYSTDASMIEGKAFSVIFPKSAQEISQIIRNSAGITIRGGGSGLVGGAVPQNCVVVDLSKMNKILNFDREKVIVEVEAGVLLDELNEYLSRYNLEFPVQPSSHAIATIGGMIATNAVGSRAIKYGRTSEWIDSLEVVNGKGEIIIVKKTDVSDFSGMEGITGVIVKAKLRLVNKKKRTANLFEFTSLQDVVDAAARFKLEKSVSAIEFIDKFTSGLIGMPDNYHLIVEFESDEGKLKDREYEKVMSLRDSIYPALASAGYVRIEDPKIMLNRFPELAELLEKNKIPFFGHLGVGIIHPCFRKEQEKIIEETIKLTKKLHGQISGEHGIGISKKKFLEPSDIKLIERIKKRNDPLNKLNCGKVIDVRNAHNDSISEHPENSKSKQESFLDVKINNNAADKELNNPIDDGSSVNNLGVSENENSGEVK